MNTKPMTEEQLGQITTAVEGLETSLEPLQVVPVSERRGLPTVGRHREQFAAIALEAGRQFEMLLPRDLDLVEVAAIRQERQQMLALRQKLRHLTSLLEGHVHALGNADYEHSTRIYRVLRGSTRVAQYDVNSVLDALGNAYMQSRVDEEEEEVTTPAA